MRCRGLFKFAFTLGLVCGATATADAQSVLPNSGSILPIPISSVQYASVEYPHTNVNTPSLYNASNAVKPEHVRGKEKSTLVSPDYSNAMTSPWDSLNGGSADGQCADVFGGGSCNPWYFRAAALAMSRDNANTVWTSYDTADSSSELLGSRSDGWDWTGGFEFALGRRISQNWALEGVYWSPNQFNSSAGITNAGLGGNLSSPLDFTGVSIGGTNVGAWFDNAVAHRIDRRSYFYNLELNLIHLGCNSGGCTSGYDDGLGSNSCNTCGPTWGCSWFAGLRYFRFEDEMNFWTSDTDTVFDYSGDDVVYGVDLTNNLIGFQLGGRIDRYVCGRMFNFWAAPRVGVYGNRIEHRSWVATGDNQFAYDIKTNKDDLAIVAQLDFGVDWQISCNWKAFVGYRVVAVSGVALVENQVPQFMADTNGIGIIDSNGHVLLHGGFAGIEYRF